MTSLLCSVYYFFSRRFFLILWISLVLYLFYNTFVFYKTGRQFYRLRRMLGLGLCISRGTATVLNLCCALVLLPLCKKLNQVLFWILSTSCSGLFFFWLEKAKSFHMTVAVTLAIFAVIHSISHLANLWNFSRGYDEQWIEINFANYKNENPLFLLASQAGVTGVVMLLIILSMALTSLRVVRRRLYNAFWYTHQFYFPLLGLLLIHPLSGVLKQEILDDNNTSQNISHDIFNNFTLLRYSPQFVPIRSKTMLWMVLPLSCYSIDLIWRIFTRNRSRSKIIGVTHMPGRTMSIRLSSPHDHFVCRMGQYVLLQCLNVSLLEWHPFTVVKVPTSSQRELTVWIRVKGDWTEALEKLLLENEPSNVSILLDGPFSSPMQGVCRSEIAICVAAGVGITPFVAMLNNMLINPRSSLPGRVHLIWIVRHECEIKWIADLVETTMKELRNANRPDRLNIELYVTSRENNLNNKYSNDQNAVHHIVTINEKCGLRHVLLRNDNAFADEKINLLTPHMKRVEYSKNDNKVDNIYEIGKEYPLLGCRVRRGRPHWDRVFGYWVNLYPGEHLQYYCCGPKKLVKLLRNQCKINSRTTRTKFTFIHEGFS